VLVPDDAVEEEEVYGHEDDGKSDADRL